MGGRGKSSSGKQTALAAASNGGESVTSSQMDMLRNTKYGEMMTSASSSDRAAGAVHGLSSNETDLIHSYTADMYTELNANLRSGDPGATQFMKDKINIALDKLPAHKGTTYRSINVPDANKFVSNLSGSKHFKFDDLVSTTRDRGQLSNFTGNIHFEITSKRGRSVEHIASQKSEKEVLFRAGSRFKYTSSSTSKGVTTIKIKEL